MRIAVILCFFCSVSVSPSALAQTTTASVLGTVTDAQGAVVPGATITVRNVETGSTTSVVSDANGRFRAGALRPGIYQIRVELSGFAPQSRNDISLFVGQEVSIDFELGAAGVQEAVIVTAGARVVETTKSDVSTVIDRAQIDSLPLSARNFSDLTRLTPDVLSGDRIGGMQSSLSNTYFVDGVTNDRAWTGGSRSGYSAENIREFRVMTQQYAAEFGQASGGVVNVVTRSGTNTFANRLFLFHRDDALDARNAFARSKAPFDRQQYGGFSGGPIARDRTFYFGSYERIRQDETAVVTAPIAPGEFPRPLTQTLLFGKVDYQLAPAHMLTVRGNEDRFDSENEGVGGRSTLEYGSTSFYRNHDAFSSLTSALGPTRLNELRAQYARRPSGDIPNSPGSPALIFASSNRGKPTGSPTETVEWRFQLVDNFTWHISGVGGEHAIKAGFDYSKAVLEGFFCNFCDGEFRFPRDTYDPADPTTFPTLYTRRVGSGDFTIPNTIYAAFLQDSWRPRPNLTINAGLRYDYEEYAGGIVSDGNVSPRFGVSFDPANRGRTVVRGGAGFFQDQITLNQWLIIVLNVIERAGVHRSE